MYVITFPFNTFDTCSLQQRSEVLLSRTNHHYQNAKHLHRGAKRRDDGYLEIIIFFYVPLYFTAHSSITTKPNCQCRSSHPKIRLPRFRDEPRCENRLPHHLVIIAAGPCDTGNYYVIFNHDDAPAFTVCLLTVGPFFHT